MAERTALAWIEPYLDGQLGAPEVALFEKAVHQDPALEKLLKAHHAFHSFLRRSLLHDPAPAGLQERIRVRLSSFGQAPGAASVPPVAWGRKWLRFAAALLLISCAMITYQVLCPEVGLCRYVSACTQEHQRIAAEARVLPVSNEDQVMQVCRETGCDLNCVPRLDGLHLAGAGTVPFTQLQSIGAPRAAFLRYEGPAEQPVVLFLHNWPSESPTVERIEYQGRGFWVAEYEGIGCVSWRMSDGRVLCSVTGRCPRSEILRLALVARTELERTPGHE